MAEAELHERLVALQPDEELRRKAEKARQRGIWTQEDIDLANREAKRLLEWLRWE